MLNVLFSKRKGYRLCLDRKKYKGKYMSKNLVNLVNANANKSDILPIYLSLYPCKIMNTIISNYSLQSIYPPLLRVKSK